MRQPATTATPNHYELRGKGTEIVYSTSSITGKPLFNYKGKPLNKSVTGADIRTEETEIGSLVTVTLEQIPDLRTVTLTVLLPAINLQGTATATAFKTTAILTTNRTSIGGPGLVKGPIQTYEAILLDGKARRVRF